MESVDGKDATAETTMIVDCLRCSTRYRVRSTDVPLEGRLLRCSRCSHSWYFRHADSSSRSEVQATPSASVAAAPSTGNKRGSLGWRGFWWGYAVASVGILFVAVYAYREDISALLPYLREPLDSYAVFVEDLFFD